MLVVALSRSISGEPSRGMEWDDPTNFAVWFFLTSILSTMCSPDRDVIGMFAPGILRTCLLMTAPLLCADMVVVLLLSILVCSIEATHYPFHTKTYTVLDKRTDPYLLDYHHTRYTAGCLKPTEDNYEYNKIVPFIQNFDLVVTGCGINWNNPFTYSNAGTCVYILNNRSTTAHTIERIHVHPDKPHIDYFFHTMLPYFEKQWTEKKKGIILASGGGDAGPNHQQARAILNSGAILRWIVEQSRLEELVDNPRVMLLPVGLCIREAVGERGQQLRDVLSEGSHQQSSQNHSVEQANDPTSHRRGLNHTVKQEAEYPPGDFVIPDVYNATLHLPMIRKLQAAHPASMINSGHDVHRLLQEAIGAALPWKHRKDRIFVCFKVGLYENRKKYMDFARENCTVCDPCSGVLPVSELWRHYGQYKYVLSPWGNGMDCGRSWEILILGAVPVIEYFSGVHGYAQAGLSTVLVREPEELNPRNVSEWGRFAHAQDPSRLTFDFWTNRMFNETLLL